MKYLNTAVYQIIYNVSISDSKQNIKAFTRAYIMNDKKLQARSNRVMLDTESIHKTAMRNYFFTLL